MTLVLDTCAVLWAVSQPEALSESAREALTAEDASVCVSPISCAEIACAVDRKRVVLDRHWRTWFRHHVTANQWQVIDIDLALVEEAYSLPEPFHRDPADRLIVATARRLNAAVVTADKKMLAYPHVQTVW